MLKQRVIVRKRSIRTKQRRWSSALKAAAVTMLLLAVSFNSSPASADAKYTFEIGTFNMAGGHDVYSQQGEDVINELYESIQSRRPAFVTVQEACLDWVFQLESMLPYYGIHFDPVLESPGGKEATCKNANDEPRSPFGNAVIYRHGLGFSITSKTENGFPLGTPSGEQREMLCIASDILRSVVCSIHLTPDGREVDRSDYRSTELSNALARLENDFGSYLHFLGGDFNTDPWAAEMKQIYHENYLEGSEGDYQEVDSPCGEAMTPPLPQPDPYFCRAGEHTHDDWSYKDWFFEEWSPVGRKIDYLFVTPVVPVADADATTAAYSDHDPLWATIGLGG